MKTYAQLIDELQHALEYYLERMAFSDGKSFQVIISFVLDNADMIHSALAQADGKSPVAAYWDAMQEIHHLRLVMARVADTLPDNWWTENEAYASLLRDIVQEYKNQKYLDPDGIAEHIEATTPRIMPLHSPPAVVSDDFDDLYDMIPGPNNSLHVGASHEMTKAERRRIRKTRRKGG